MSLKSLLKAITDLKKTSKHNQSEIEYQETIDDLQAKLEELQNGAADYENYINELETQIEEQGQKFTNDGFS